MRDVKSYRLICLNSANQIVYYRWYIYSGALHCAQQQIRRQQKRDVARFVVGEFPSAESMKIQEAEVKRLNLHVCAQCFCRHNDGDVNRCGKCRLKRMR